ncbi:hypothetical protein [Saccharibacillus kuerlensis]|uniref:Lipoprotein n=1 Tax=Saccharibacillus kuerlensis TaxID=459527 RepID=A0ABQ2L476_9BACL|nr:hypothetical protein [Saccharibacillus kuerlensis]GGO02340.1 hypothetical protein GCM10010969_25550 [Saccharibacillus kuerlensis]
MKKCRSEKIFGVLILFALILAISGCGQASVPPKAAAETLSGERMEMVQGSYHWKGNEVERDTPPELIRMEDVLAFPPTGGIRLEFEGEEPFEVSAELWDMENPQGAAIPVGNGTAITLPKTPGYYALNVRAVWQNKDYATYALSIEIEEP